MATIDPATFQRWLDEYVHAWRTYEPELIGALFTDDASYGYHPEDEPVVGRDAIVASWLEDRDEPGTYDARYEPLAIDGEVHVARGSSRYFDAQGNLIDQYANIFICRFDDAARCAEFTDYWIQSHRFARREAARAEGG